jgi:nitrous oxide reductase accessory protein NosL
MIDVGLEQGGFEMSRKLWTFSVIFGLLFTSAALALAEADKDIQAHPSCKYCGMNRQMFAHSRMFIEYDDGTILGTCSVHCAATDLALHIDKTPVSIKVGDYFSKELIDAESAAWVIGGDKPGVMTKRAKWAFANKGEAEKFIKENGGKLATFDEVMKAAYEDMYDDTRMIREKRKARGAPPQDHKGHEGHKHN